MKIFLYWFDFNTTAENLHLHNQLEFSNLNVLIKTPTCYDIKLHWWYMNQSKTIIKVVKNFRNWTIKSPKHNFSSHEIFKFSFAKKMNHLKWYTFISVFKNVLNKINLLRTKMLRYNKKSKWLREKIEAVFTLKDQKSIWCKYEI